MALGIGKVKGQYITALIDSADVDADPDLVPLNGTITFNLNVGVVVNVGDTANPVVIGSSPITGVLDSAGYLCTPDADGNPTTVREVALIANDDPDNNPTATQYTVTYNLKAPDTRSIDIAPHLITVNSGVTLDLALVAPVSAAPPQQTMGIITTMTQEEFDEANPPEYQITFITAT